MILKNLNKNGHWLIIGLTQLSLILLCMSRLAEEELLKFYFNTDSLYLPSIFIDVFLDGNSPHGWSLTPAPYFFPDMPLYFLIYALVGNVSYSIVIYSFIQLLLIEVFFYKTISIVIGNRATAKYILMLAAMFIQLFLIAGAVSNEPFVAQLLINSASHLGAVLLSLMTFYLLFTYLVEAKRKYLIWATVLIIVSIVSDRIFLLQTGVTILVLSVYYTIKRNDKWLIIYMVGSMIIGWFSFRFLQRYVIYIPFESRPPYSVNQSVINFLDGFSFIQRHFILGGVILYFHLFVLVLSPIVTFLVVRERRPLYLALSMTAIMSFLFPILSGYINAIDTFRYLMYSYILCCMLFPFMLCCILNLQRLKLFLMAIIICYTSFISIWFIFTFDQARMSYFFHFKPSYIELLEKKSYLFKNGVSDYWTSKQFYQFGDRHYRVVSIHKSSEAFMWQANKTWFVNNNKSKSPLFNFSFDLKLDNVLGPPKDSILVPPHQVYIYKDFVFEEDINGNIHMVPVSK